MSTESGQSLDTSINQDRLISPDLIYALNLIRKPAIDLRKDIFQKLVNNPTLELVSYNENEVPLDSQSTDVNEDDSYGDDNYELSHEIISKELFDSFSNNTEINDLNKSDAEINETDITNENDIRSDESFIEYNSRENGYVQSSDVRKRDFLVDQLSYSENLQDHLLQQLRLSTVSSYVKQIAELIIGNIDERGYLASNLNVLKQDINYLEGIDYLFPKALKLVQSFDPVGVGAVDLQECILLQLKKLHKDNLVAQIIAKNHFKELSQRKYSNIAKSLGIKLYAVKSAANLISTLKPVPGIKYQQLNIFDYIVPDVIIKYFKNTDEVIVELNNDYIPKLQISHNYRDIMLRYKDNKSIKDYFKEKFLDGKIFLNHLQSRNNTILKIAQEIADIQKDFIKKGMEYLKPMTMKEIANKVGVHESTVSRATSGKYIETPRGIFIMKSLFSGSLQKTENNLDTETLNNLSEDIVNKGDSEISSGSIKEKISNLIKNEPVTKPFSDNKISELLKEDGINIARRTVTKYREQLKIAKAQFRKKI